MQRNYSYVLLFVPSEADMARIYCRLERRSFSSIEDSIKLLGG